jgi:hypothetical protein
MKNKIETKHDVLEAIVAEARYEEADYITDLFETVYNTMLDTRRDYWQSHKSELDDGQSVDSMCESFRDEWLDRWEAAK